MCSSGHRLFRSLPVHLPAAALAVLGFLPAIACSLGEGEDTGVIEELSATSSPCGGVSIDARRDYRPPSWTDGHAAFPVAALSFAVPAAIPVTFGRAGDGKVELIYSSGSGAPTTCVYRGNGAGGRGGRKYLFHRCRADAAGSLPVAGSTVSADRLTLHVERGDRSFRATVVHLALPRPEAEAMVCRGKANFHDRTLAGLGGNGRACSDCHMDSERFQLTPAAAHARFDAMIASGEDDPLFRPLDADDFRESGEAAQDYTNLIENGLVRVTIPLPPNVKLLDCGSMVPCPASARPTLETVADVWRSVPTILDVNITGPDGVAPWVRGPNAMGGYQHDARLDTLQNQALSALRGHATVAVDPPARWLDDVAGFQAAQFSSARVKDLSDAMAAGDSPLPDPDPALDELELQGKAVFNRACAQCHGDLSGHPGGSTPTTADEQGRPTLITRYHDVFTACPRPVDSAVPPRFSFAPCSPSQMENVRTYQITNSGVAPTGTPCGGPAPQPPCVTRLTTSDPGRLLLTGFPAPGGPGDIQHLDVPSLRGISQTAPYFSNNTSASLEDMVEHYKQFFKRVAILAPQAPILTTQPGVLPPVHDRPFIDAEVPALLAYLRKL
jgi:cytochrome c peroxidase